MSHSRSRLQSVLGLVLGWCVVGLTPAWSQAPITRAALNAITPATTSNITSNTGTSAVSLEEKLARARADLAVMTARISSGTNLPPGYRREDLFMRRGLLSRLVRLYEQQATLKIDLADLRNRRPEITRETQAWRGFAEPRPYSILLVDALQESLQLEREEIGGAEKTFAMLDKLTEQHRSALKNAEERIRQLNEEMEGGKDTRSGGGLAWRRDLERLQSQNAAATIAVLDLERQTGREREALSRMRLGLLERQLIVAKAGSAFTDADVERVNARLDAEQLALENELAVAETRGRAAAQVLESANQALNQARPTNNAASLVRLREQVEVRRAQADAADIAVDALRFILQAGTIERALWEARFSTFRSGDSEMLRLTNRKLEQFRERAALWRNDYHRRMQHTARQIERLEARLADLQSPADLTPLVREQLSAWRDADQILLRVVRRLERGDRQFHRMEQGLREAASHLPALGRFRNAFSDSRSFFSQLWNLELFVAQDAITVDGQTITGTRSITLGKVLSAILLVAVGFWLTGLISRRLEPVFIKRFKIEVNQASLIRRWVRVALVFILALFSLASVKIPLTVFAFAGGALAIGLGFGLQTLLKNFVSGIIILFERPFRVGDVLDVAGKSGTISSIGIRSSVLQQSDGTETLIPNSTLLENNLTNWTYSNRAVRFSVTVGVAYGSDPRRVMQLLSDIADRHGVVEKEPKPQALFINFGDNTLDFELRYWVDVVKGNSSLVASDLRQMIAGAFAENGINIAYPQRDLHLNSARPIEVRVLAGGNPPEPTPENDAGTRAISPAVSEHPDGTAASAATDQTRIEPKGGPKTGLDLI